jgi:hypothetical protein
VSAPLPTKQAAASLGVSVATLKRWCRDGTGVVRRGRGRHNCTLYDVNAISASRGLQAAQRGAMPQEPVAEIAAQLQRGAAAHTLDDALADELHWIYRGRDLERKGVSSRLVPEVVEYIGARLIRRAQDHLRLPRGALPKKLSKIGNG